MTFQEFLSTIGLSTTSFWGIAVFLMSIGIEIIPKIKWSPWSALFKYIGARFNDGINKKIDSLDGKVDKVEADLKKHIAESEVAALQDTRRHILEFCNACMNKRKHTREQFRFVIKECDEYEIYMENNNIKNAVVTAAIHEIKRIYENCIHENSFLKEGEENNE